MNENLLIQDMFVWLWAKIDSKKEHEMSIDNMILKKFDMCLYHQHERNDQLNKSWLKTMFYSLSQQIIKQDIEYWTLYACLCLNLNTQLVFYLYYVKYVLLNDSTFFYHIDMNVFKYLKDEYKSNIILEFVSLNDKNIYDYTEIMSEFHKHIENWWKKIEIQEKASNDHVHDLEKIYLKENIIEYEDFVSISCQ